MFSKFFHSIVIAMIATSFLLSSGCKAKARVPIWPPFMKMGMQMKDFTSHYPLLEEEQEGEDLLLANIKLSDYLGQKVSRAEVMFYKGVFSRLTLKMEGKSFKPILIKLSNSYPKGLATKDETGESKVWKMEDGNTVMLEHIDLTKSGGTELTRMIFTYAKNKTEAAAVEQAYFEKLLREKMVKIMNEKIYKAVLVCRTQGIDLPVIGCFNQGAQLKVSDNKGVSLYGYVDLIHKYGTAKKWSLEMTRGFSFKTFKNGPDHMVLYLEIQDKNGKSLYQDATAYGWLAVNE